MFDLIKSILKWVIIVVLFVLLIVLLSRLATRKENKANTQPLESGVQSVDRTLDDEEFEPIVDDNATQSDLLVDTPDTGVTAGLTSVIGIIVLAGTTYFIYKKREA